MVSVAVIVYFSFGIIINTAAEHMAIYYIGLNAALQYTELKI